MLVSATGVILGREVWMTSASQRRGIEDARRRDYPAGGTIVVGSSCPLLASKWQAQQQEDRRDRRHGVTSEPGTPSSIDSTRESGSAKPACPSVRCLEMSKNPRTAVRGLLHLSKLCPPAQASEATKEGGKVRFFFVGELRSQD